MKTQQPERPAGYSTNYVIRESTLRNSAAPYRRLYPLSEAFEVSSEATLHVVEANAVSS